MDGRPSVIGRPAVARRSTLIPGATGCHGDCGLVTANLTDAKWLPEHICRQSLEARSNWRWAHSALSSLGERARETDASLADRTLGNERRRAGDGESAHRLMARDVPRAAARTHACEALHRKRSDTVAADARSPSRTRGHSCLRRRPARRGRCIWVLQQATHRPAARSRFYRRGERALCASPSAEAGSRLWPHEGNGQRPSRARPSRLWPVGARAKRTGQTVLRASWRDLDRGEARWTCRGSVRLERPAKFGDASRPLTLEAGPSPE